MRRLRLTKQELTATAEVLDETIEELRPEEGAEASGTIHLAKREKQVARLYAKLNVHSAVQLTSEMQKFGLDK